MKKAKSIAALFTALCMAAAVLAGCGEEKKDNADETSAPAATEVQQSGPVEAGWFDDSVFVGDSVTLKLSYYCDGNPDALGQAQFFCAGSLGYGSALWDIDDPNAVHPFYQGELHLAEDCAQVTGASKVFLMLGMNDIGLYGVDESIENCKTLVANIKKKSPSATIYIQSVTPILMGKEYETLKNELIREFNSKLESFCKTDGIKFFDLYSVFADENGYLKAEYCGDQDAMGIHFTDAACQLWANYLKENVL